jgi:hypothetical protein
MQVAPYDHLHRHYFNRVITLPQSNKSCLAAKELDGETVRVLKPLTRELRALHLPYKPDFHL